MGALFDYICGLCGYKATVSKGKDSGFEAFVQPMICHSCHELSNILIGYQGQEGPSGNPYFDADLGKCSLCGSTEITPWTTARECPKCDGRMQQSDKQALLWD